MDTTTTKRTETKKRNTDKTVAFKVKAETYEFLEALTESLHKKTGVTRMKPAQIASAIFEMGLEPFLEHNELYEILKAYRSSKEEA